MNKFSFTELAIMQMLEVEELYGYAMTVKMHDASYGKLKLPAGSLYPALHKLERDGMVRSRLDSASLRGRKRKYYSLTATGLKSLIVEIESWRAMVRTMDKLLGV